jgi:hypothetical protein
MLLLVLLLTPWRHAADAAFNSRLTAVLLYRHTDGHACPLD